MLENVFVSSRNSRIARRKEGNIVKNCASQNQSEPLTTVQLHLHKKLKLGDQIVDLQQLKDRYPHLRNLPHQSYNLNEVRVILGKDSYYIHHLLEIEKSEERIAPRAMRSEFRWANCSILSEF